MATKKAIHMLKPIASMALKLASPQNRNSGMDHGAYEVSKTLEPFARVTR